MAQIGGHSINSLEVIHFLNSEEEFRNAPPPPPPRLNRVEIDSLFSYSPLGEHYSVASRTIPKPSL